MEIFKILKKPFLLIILGGIVLLATGYFAYEWYIANGFNDNTEDIILSDDSSLTEENDIKEEEPLEKVFYFVDIKGEVNNPGVYVLEDGKRVVNVIELAGGLTNNADVSVINLSRRVFDEMVIIVYSKSEVKRLGAILPLQTNKQQECVTHVQNINNNACVENKDININGNSNASQTGQNEETENPKVSLNTASLSQLMTLSGIGESKAKAIIEYREKSGGFKDITELKNVSGIGDATFEKIRDNITI